MIAAPEGLERLRGIHPDVPIWTYAVTKSYASKHGATVTAFLTAVKQATQWAVAHPTDAATLRSEGGAVDVSIVLPSCGSGSADDASHSLLWSGSTMLSPTTS